MITDEGNSLNAGTAPSATKEYHVYTPENLLEQARHTLLVQGYHTLEFCIDENGQLAKHATNQRAVFYYSPSGGTLRDSSMNIVLYSARFDKFKGIGKAE